MINRILFIVLLGYLLSPASLYACDACGCSANGPGIGLLTDYRNNFIRLGYFSTHFVSSPEHGNQNTDYFRQLDLAARFSLDPKGRWRMDLHLPYGMNLRHTKSETISLEGLADVRINVNYALLNNSAPGTWGALYLEAGIGTSIPLGSYDPDIRQRNLPENFNTGRGAMGYLFQANGVWTYQKSGLVINNNYQLNSSTDNGYQFGSSYHTQATVFHELRKGSLAFVPNTGVGFESVAPDTYANNNTVPETGARGLFFAAGLNVKSGNAFSGIAWAYPFRQTYSNGIIEAKGRLSCHVTFIF